MSERMSRGKDLEASYAPAASRGDLGQPVRSTPEEQAHESIVVFAREASSLTSALDDVRQAGASNDLERWTQARTGVASMLGRANQSLERARARAHEATPEGREQLAAAEKELEQQRAAFDALTEAPTGFATVSEENEILAAFEAPLEGGLRIGFEEKEAALKSRFDRLAPADRRVLAERFRKARPNDLIAAAFSRLTESRRQSLLEHLAFAGQREARQREAELRGAPVVASVDVAEESPPSPASKDGFGSSSEPPAIVVTEPETLDVKLRKILESSDTDAAIESLFAQATGSLDGTTRRALAKRLEIYRPGSGDDIAARFMRLDRALQQRISNGLRSAPAKLPDQMRGELEAATGTSLAHVNVHADEAGNATAAAHGARAVAIGSDVHMRAGQFDPTSADGRELIAHEVAHVVQAQTHPGPTRSAAKREEPDETNADSAAETDADLFAAQFREHGGAASWTPSVGIDGATPMRAPDKQAKPATKPRIEDRYKTPQLAPTYFAVHERRFFDAVKERLSSLPLPSPHKDLAWTGTPAKLAEAFEPALIAGGGGAFNLFERLPRLLYPADPWRVIDQHRDLDVGRPGELFDGKSAMGTIEWNPIVGFAIAVELEARLRESLPRMGLRFVAAAEQQTTVDVKPDELVASHPFDRVVAHLVCDPTVARYVASKTKHRSKQPRDTDAPAAFKDGLRFTIVEWQGQQNPKLWNWVKVVEPANATKEEVAMSVFERGDGVNHTEYAYGITGSSPYFCVAPRWARDLPGAKDFAPDNVTDDPEASSALALADTKLGNEAAIAQAARTVDPRQPRRAPNIAQLAHMLEQSELQLRLAGEWLEPWKLYHLVGPALRWVAKHREHIDGTPTTTLQKWAPVIEGQRKTLLEATGEISEVAEAAGRLKSAPSSSDAKPFRDVLQSFAIAMGESHLVESATTQLAGARQLKAMLPFTLLDRSLRETHGAKQDFVAQKPKRDAVDRVDLAAGAEASQQGLQRAAIEMRAKAIAGEAADVSGLEAVAVAASEDGLRYRTRGLGEKATVLFTAIDDANSGMTKSLANVFDKADIRRIQTKLLDLRSASYRIRHGMDKRITEATATLAADPATKTDTQGYLVKLMDARKASVAQAQHELSELSSTMQLQTFFDEIFQKLDDMRWRTMWVDLALMIGISIAGGMAGAFIGGAVRGAMLADAAVNTMAFARSAQTARRVGFAANVVTDAAVTSIGQTVAFGDRTELAFVESLLSNVAIIAALRPLRAATSKWMSVEKAATMWSRAGKLGAKTAIVTTEMITSAAIGYVATRMVKGQPPPSDDVMAAWALQGASMAIGRFISGRLTNLQARLQGGAEELVHLCIRAQNQKQLAKQVEGSGNSEKALSLLDQYHRLLSDEHALLHDNAKLARLGLDAQQVRTMRAGNDAALADASSQTFATMRLHFHGLEPLAENAKVWSGTAEHIQAALADAKGGATIINADPKAGRWRAKIAGQEIVFVEANNRRPTNRPPLKGPPPDVDASYHVAHAQQDAVAHLKQGTATEAHRKLAADEIERQVPDVALTVAVGKGAKTVVSVVTPGGGKTGIKSLNDDLVGKALADELIKDRNQVFGDVFAKHGLEVIHTSYKTVTVVSSKSPAEIGDALRLSIREIDVAMKSKLRNILDKGEAQWNAKLGEHAAGSDDFKAAKKRVDAIRRLKKDPDLAFVFQLGAAEIQGGKSASYEQILSSEMNATKAAIMARDTTAEGRGGKEIGDQRGLIYSQEEFVKFAKATIAMRDALQNEKRTLPWGGEQRKIIDDDGDVDREIAYAVRKHKLTNENVGGQTATLTDLKRLIDRINTLDYLTRYLGTELQTAGKEVKHAVDLVNRLRDLNSTVGSDTAASVAKTLNGDVARSGTASEAQFLNRASRTKDRVVLNADIKDLGLDVAEGNLRAMEGIAGGGAVDAVSRAASDEIIKMKGVVIEKLTTYYTDELVPAAKQRIVERNRRDLLPFLQGEEKPMLLLGGDEVTLSLPRVFEELGLVPNVVTFLQTNARARVAVTKTANLDGARGHERAMKAAEAAHSILKSYEEIARELDLRMNRWEPEKQRHARELVQFFNGLYTSEEHGRTAIRHVDGTAKEKMVSDRVAAANRLLGRHDK